jgi:hypothetical protein
MKRTLSTRILFGTALAVAVVMLAAAAQAQPSLTPEQLAALTPMDPATVPNHGSFWFLKGPNGGRPCPPLPCPPGDLPGVPIYDAGGGEYIVDDRDVDWAAIHAAEMELSSLEDRFGLGGGSNGPSPMDYSASDGLCLSITAASNNLAQLVLHNTTNGVPYEILNSETLTNRLTNWISEGLWVAQSNTTPANVTIGSRTNQLFFRGRVWAGTFDHGVPRNGELFVLASSNVIYPVINGATNGLSPFCAAPAGGNWFLLNPPGSGPLYQVNLGYDANDDGPISSVLGTNAPQGVLRLVGFSSTITNLCLSYNPLTNINVSGWPALQDLECWHCTNMQGVAVTSCPQLSRVCFESIEGNSNPQGIMGALDLTACPKIADIRAANNNRMTNIIFADGAGPNVWHLCVHDDTGLPANYDFSRFPSLSQLWIWRDTFGGALGLSHSVCTNLTSVQSIADHFASMNYSGQTTLTQLWIWDDAEMTNLVVSGCSSLLDISGWALSLSQAAVDGVLVDLDQMGAHGGYLNLRGSAPFSETARSARDSLLNKGWYVSVEEPISGPTNAAPIWFTNISATVAMRVSVNAGASVSWYWGDNTTALGVYQVTKTNLPAGSSNAVVVSPASALKGFAAGASDSDCNGGASTRLSSVSGLTNYPNLQELHLYETGLTDLSLAGCSNLVVVALAGTYPSSPTENGWFTNLAAAQPAKPLARTFHS